MKKKFKVIIGVSAFCTVACLFASLIFCAVNAFPELLEIEMQDNQAAGETLNVVPTVFNNEAENNDVVYIVEGNDGGFAPANYDARDVVIVQSSGTKGNDKVVIETPIVEEEVKTSKGKEHFSGFYEYRYEEDSKEKFCAVNLRKDEKDQKILECTLLVMVIVQALGFAVLQHKNKEPQIECLENRENHQD